jgi:hypothetical protein
MNADMHLPLFPADGTIVMRDKLTGAVRSVITPAATEKMKQWQAEDERAEAEHQKYWRKALEAALLKDLRENDRLDELAGWLMIFGDTDGLKLFRETVLASGTLDGCPSPEKIIFDVWNEHHESPGDWRGLIWHVRELEGGGGGGGGEPPTPAEPLPVGAVPETSPVYYTQV